MYLCDVVWFLVCPISVLLMMCRIETDQRGTTKHEWSKHAFSGEFLCTRLVYGRRVSAVNGI